MSAPRIKPGGRGDLGVVNMAIARFLGLVSGTKGPPNIFTTLGRHKGLFRRWLRFAGGLMPGGKLPRRESELVILRVAHLCGSDYEWAHHERIAREAGVSSDEVGRVPDGPGAAGWSGRDAAILTAVDELHADRRVSDATWARLRGELSDEQLIELCLLAGHYEMLAGTLNSLGVEPDPYASGRGHELMAKVRKRAARLRG